MLLDISSYFTFTKIFNRTVIEVGNSKDSLENMDDGEDQIEFEPALGENEGVEAMNIDKWEREKRKSKEFEKDKSKSNEDKSGQNKQRINNGASSSVPAHPGEVPNLQQRLLRANPPRTQQRNTESTCDLHYRYR